MIATLLAVYLFVGVLATGMLNAWTELLTVPAPRWLRVLALLALPVALLYAVGMGVGEHLGVSWINRYEPPPTSRVQRLFRWLSHSQSVPD